MSADTWLAFALFAFVSSITPGPNNTMMLASGVHYGFSRSLPHMAGITLGFCLMILLMGLGLGSVFARYPALYTAMRYAGGAYMLYLAWKILRSQPVPDNAAPGSAQSRPMGFTAAAAFQWVNPKAWIMAIGAITTYTPQEGFLVNVLLIAALFALVNYPSVGLWTVAGSLLRRWLDRPRVLRAFNIGMALLLVASLYPILIDVKGSL